MPAPQGCLAQCCKAGISSGTVPIVTCGIGYPQGTGTWCLLHIHPSGTGERAAPGPRATRQPPGGHQQAKQRSNPCPQPPGGAPTPRQPASQGTPVCLPPARTPLLVWRAQPCPVLLTAISLLTKSTYILAEIPIQTKNFPHSWSRQGQMGSARQQAGPWLVIRQITTGFYFLVPPGPGEPRDRDVSK